MLDMTYIDPVLKEFYGTTYQSTLNNEVNLKKYIEEAGSKNFDGKYYTFPVHYRRNSGVGARAEKAALPTAGYQGFETCKITSAYLYGRISLTGQAMATSDKTTFAKAFATESEGVKTDLMVDIGRQTYGEGLGILAEVNISGSETVASAGTSQQVRNRYAATGQPGARYINAGAVISIGTVALPENDVTGTTVSSVTISTNSGTTYDLVNIAASANTATAAFMFNTLAGGAGIEIKGLRAIVDDTTSTNTYGNTGGFFNNTTIFNIDRDSDGVTTWNAYVNANGGVERLINSYILQKTMSQTEKKTGKDIDIIFGEHDAIDAFWDSVAGDRRFNSAKFDAGSDTVTFNGKTFVKDWQAPYNEMFLLNKESFRWYMVQGLQFDEHGGILKNISGYDEAEAFVKGYFQFGPNEMCGLNANAAIRDIKVDL